jgi:hypothetical protein
MARQAGAGPGLRIISGRGGADDIGRKSDGITTTKRTENVHFAPYVPTRHPVVPDIGHLSLMAAGSFQACRRMALMITMLAVMG